MATETMNDGLDALVTGAAGGIGGAVVNALLCDANIRTVVAVSRSGRPPHGIASSSKLVWLCCDYSEESMQSVVNQLAVKQCQFSRVAICHGVLHGDAFWPEKRLEDLNAESLNTLFSVNAVVPVLWLKVLRSCLKGDAICKVAVLSARVGSISDNELGGWYAYRASKAALNMLLKTAAIEYARRIKNVKIISFHPGTTDTPLSKPFQSSVPSKKLFTTDFVASCLLREMDTADVDGQLSFLDWDGARIEW